MKILQIIPYFEWSYGGPVKVVYDLSKELTKRGHEVSIYTTDVGLNGSLTENQKIKSDFFEIRYFNCLNNRLANNLKLHLSPKMRKALKDNVNNFDIVHIHEWRGIAQYYASKYAKKYEIPYFLQAHGSSPLLLGKQDFKRTVNKQLFDIILGKKYFSQAHKIIAVSNFEKQLFIEKGINVEKIVVVPNSLEFKEVKDLTHKNEFKRKYRIKDNEKIILYIGRLHQMKGIDVLIKAFEKITKLYEDIKLVIVGPDDGYKINLEKMVKELLIEDYVLFTGPLFGREKQMGFIDADLLVYPSTYEIFGLVPFEAILYNTPVIVSKGTGCGEYIDEARCGLTVQYGDFNDLKNKIEYLLENPDLGRKMVKNGQEYIKTNLTSEVTIKKIEDLYRHAVTKEVL